MAAGFKSPAIWLGLSSPPLPAEAGFRGLMAFWAGGASSAVAIPIKPGGQHSTYAPRYDWTTDLILREDEEITEILSILASQRLI